VEILFLGQHKKRLSVTFCDTFATRVGAAEPQGHTMDVHARNTLQP
jgi:hypothetical protein